MSTKAGDDIVNLLAQNDIQRKCLREAAQKIIHALHTNTSLTELHLAANEIQEIPEFPDHPSLQTLDISDNVIGNAGINNIFAKLTGLTSLDVKNIGLSDEGLAIIERVIFTEKKLKALNIAENLFFRVPQQQNLLGNLVSKHSSLTFLNLSFVSVLPEDLLAMGEAIAANQTLKTLIMGHNAIPFDKVPCFEEFTTAFSTNDTLETLVLEAMQIYDHHARVLFENLRHNTALQKLNLKKNQISQCGYISDTLKDHKYLKSLDLSQNLINEEGVITILQSLAENDSLTYLNLMNGTIFGPDRGTTAIIDNLQQNYSILELILPTMPNYPIFLSFATKLLQLTDRNIANQTKKRFNKTKAAPK